MAKTRKRKGRVRRPGAKSNGARAQPLPQQQLQVGTAPGVVRIHFERPVKQIDLTVAQAYDLSRAVFHGAKSAHEKQQRKLAGYTAPPRKPEGEAPEILGPDGKPAPRPAVVKPREPE